MDQAAATPADDPAKASSCPETINIDPKGDVVLDVIFETSRNTLNMARKAARSSKAPAPENLKSRSRVAYRVQMSTLKKQSKYFESLLGNSQFKEARVVLDTLEKLSRANIKPAQAGPEELPWLRIEDDDEATHMAGRDAAFADLLRILHGGNVVTKPVTMSFVTALAVLADRFTCTAAISRCLATKLRFKWPATQRATKGDENASLTEAAEGLLRQKILTAWLLDQPPKMQATTRELLLLGSRQWSLLADVSSENKAAWWDLPDNLEGELRYRRECIMNTLSSVIRHFLKLYTSRGTRQCKLGYDSSAACDSYQLGEMIRFFTQKNLLHLTDFGPSALYTIPDTCQMDVEDTIATLKQIPSYQIDSNHINCGLRIRIMPILDYIQTMLSSSAVSISSTAWKGSRQSAAWAPAEEEEEKPFGKKTERVFNFTRAVAGDQRLRYEGAMAAERLARQLFTADYWDWTPDDNATSTSSFPGEFKPLGFNGDRIRR